MNEYPTVRFKSEPKYWIKERDGRKRNTARVEDPADDRFKLLRKWKEYHTMNLLIELENSVTGEVFTRIVKDVSYWMGDIVIVSW